MGPTGRCWVTRQEAHFTVQFNDAFVLDTGVTHVDLRRKEETRWTMPAEGVAVRYGETRKRCRGNDEKGGVEIGTSL